MTGSAVHDGKIAFVSGGGSGIGRAVASRLAGEGATVVLNGRDPAKLESVAAEIEAAGKGKAVCRPGDIGKADVIKAMFAGIKADFGRLDLVFNNAGGHEDFKPLHLTPEDEYEWVTELNYTSVLRCMHAQLNIMVPQGSGNIVNAGSIFGLKGVAGIAHYVAAKHAVIGLTKATALDYAGQGIRINAVCPGATLTPNLLRVCNGDTHALDGMIPFGRVGTPEEMADAVLWLMSDASSYVTGAAISIDGGMSAG